MSFARVYSAQTSSLDGQIITVEIDISTKTLHAFNIVGLPDKAVEEARDRVSSAIKNSGFRSPKQKNQKIVASLSPADVRKEGPFFDLAIALAYLLSSQEIDFDPEKKLFLGELALNGELRSVRGILPLVKTAKNLGFKEIYVPEKNALEAALISGVTIYGAETLRDIIAHINKKDGVSVPIAPQEETVIERKRGVFEIDFEDVKGQETVKRGLEIAAAGGHNIAMYGPPGTGKTMLARSFTSILPDLSDGDILEITGIHSVAGILRDDLLTRPPFRSPHHTSSYVSIIGGGQFPKPGEITLAHHGILFLDEFPEFDKRVIESLRQPLEDNVVNISRAKGSAQFPSNFILISAMNPCPCGYYGSQDKECTCRPFDIARYQRKLSGPIMDRIDIWVQVNNIDYEKLSSREKSGDSSEKIKNRVECARSIQKKRFSEWKRPISTNSEMNAKDIVQHIRLPGEVIQLLNDTAKRLQLSPRAYHRVIKLARTIADLDNSPAINQSHILEALQYRPKIQY